MLKAPAWELLLYLLVIAVLQVRVFLHGWRFSQTIEHIGVVLPGLQPGWLPITASSQVDLSDHQWRDFRRSLPLLTAAYAAFLLLSQGARWAAPGPRQRALFYACLSIVFLVVLHGWCALHVAALVLLHYTLARLLAGSRTGILLFWGIACGIFLLVRLADGLPFARISPLLSHLDSQRGMLRWHIHYNLLILRMLSFACDLHWARTAKAAAGKLPTRGAAGANPDDMKARVQQHQPLACYDLLHFWAYVAYPPLYIAGPILTFNSFASQLQQPVRLSGRQILTYALRLAVALLALELVTHTQHYNSIAKHRAWLYLQEAGLKLGARHYAEGCYWVLVFMWLKFTVIWRFFRLIAMADGIEPPENMTRCVCNNYNVEGFWRSWHASYNQWLVRYMYIPMGGNRWRLLNVWLIFTFVALWHDLEWRLLGWAWIMALAIAPEMACKAFAQSTWAKRASQGMLWRHACAAAAALNILVLMAGNMVGFVVGMDGVAPLVASIVAEPRFVAVVLATLFCAAQLMFALRS